MKFRRFNILEFALCLCASVVVLTGCDTERRHSNAELELNPQQAAGRQVYDRYCDRCHTAYSANAKQGPSLKGVFKKKFLEESGLPANDARVTEIVKEGRSKMQGFAQVLSPQQVQDLLAYLHTL